MSEGNGFLMDNYITLPTERYDRLVAAEEKIAIVERFLMRGSYIMKAELCDILGIPFVEIETDLDKEVE